jgi:transposase
MPYALSNDLRERVAAFIEAGNSCNAASRHFGTSVSFAVNLMTLYRETGSVEPRAMGGKRHGKLDAAEGFMLACLKRSHDITMPELAAVLRAETGIEVCPQSLSRWLIKKGFSFKKNPSRIRTRQVRAGQGAE